MVPGDTQLTRMLFPTNSLATALNAKVSWVAIPMAFTFAAFQNNVRLNGCNASVTLLHETAWISKGSEKRSSANSLKVGS